MSKVSLSRASSLLCSIARIPDAGSASGMGDSDLDDRPALSPVNCATRSLTGYPHRPGAIMEQLLLSCRALSSPTLCRFIQALSVRPARFQDRPGFNMERRRPR